MADALITKGVTTLATFMEQVAAANTEIPDMPLRNQIVVYLVKCGVKMKPASTAADAVAEHVSAAAEKTPKKGAKHK